MNDEVDRRLAMVFGLLGALFFVVAGLLDLASGVRLLAIGSGARAFGAWGESVILVVVGLLVGFFALFGRSRGRDRGFAAGLVLVVLVIVGWLGLGLASGVLALLGTIFTLVAGIVFLVAGR